MAEGLWRDGYLRKWSDFIAAFIPSCGTDAKWPAYRYSEDLIYFLNNNKKTTT